MRTPRGFTFLAVMLSVFWGTTVAVAEDIVIGYTGPLSGPAMEYGQDCLNGIDMAINEINSKGGIEVKGRRYSFRLEKMDDQVNPEKALRNALKLQKEQKAIAIFNPVTTTILPLMKINTEKSNEFLVMAPSSSPQITEMNNKLMIAISTPFTINNKVMTSLAWEKGWRKCAMVVTAGAYGDAWRKVFGAEWLKKGGTITVDKPTNYYTRTDFAAPLAAALATEPDFMLIGGPSSTTALIVEQARAKGFEGGFVMIDQTKIDAVLQVMEKPLGLEGSISIAMLKDMPSPASVSFIQNYTMNYKKNVTWESVLNYTGMYVLAQAIFVAGTTDNVYAIRAAFPHVFPLLGDKYPLEVYGITPGGRLISPTATQAMRHGKFTQPIIYVWWPKTEKEFRQVKKMTKTNSEQMVWKRID